MGGLNASIPLLGVPSGPAGAGGGGGGGGSTVNGSLTDGIGVSPLVIEVRGHVMSLSDALGVNDAATALRGVVLLEQLNLSQSVTPNLKFQLTAQDMASLADVARFGWGQLVSEGIGVAESVAAAALVQMFEGLGLAETVAAAAKYSQSVSEAIRIADTLARFFSGDIVETISIQPLLDGYGLKPAAVSEGLGMLEAVTPQFVVRVTVNDTLSIDDAELLQMIFNGTLADGIELAAAYISPGSSVTTWAMNTRTGAITEYSNYAFNSFARMGNKYLGASSSGLYELTGDDDDGADIVAKIKSGFAQWASTKFTMFKAAYLGIRGDGAYILRLVTTDGQAYNYTASVDGMRSTKVNVGKGLRARYFAFELESSGQDFDLDTVEFVPIVTERRV